MTRSTGRWSGRRRTTKAALALALFAPMALVGTASFGSAHATAVTHTALTLTPNLVAPGGGNSAGVAGDAAPGFDDGSIAAAAPSAGAKSEIYLTPAQLFGRTVTLGEVADVSYWTKKSSGHGLGDERDWALAFYSNPYAGDASTPTWYGDRIGAEPYFAGNLTDPANTWNEWSNTASTNRLKWYESTAGAPSANFGTSADPDYTTLIGGDALSGQPYAGHSVKFFSIQTGSSTAFGFDGQLDGLTITLTDGSTGTVNFEPNTPDCTTVCYVDDTGNDLNGGASAGDALKTIQAGIDKVQASGQVRVLPGTYSETAANRTLSSIGGSYQFGLFFGAAKPGVSLIGVTAADALITNANATQATITTNATNNFGTSGIFVEAANTTSQGVKVGPNAAGDNKTFEVIGDNFTLRYSTTAIPDGVGSVYIDDFSTNGDVVKSYHVLDNLFPDGTSVDISSGAGSTGPVLGREILRNTFDLLDGGYNAISFNGSGGVAWFVNPVGGAIIENNSFSNSTQFIRARGTYTEAEFDWQSYWNDNTYDGAAVALVTASPFVVRSYAYDAFTNVRRIGGTIQGEVDHAVANDTVLVKPGTYPESVTIDKALTLDGAGIGSTIIDGALAGNGISIAANTSNVKVSDLTVQEFEYGVYMVGDQINQITFTDVASNDSTRHGFFVGGGATKTDLMFNRVTANHNGIPGNSGRGIWIIDGGKTNVSITDGHFNNNNLVGIDLSDGYATGVTITGNEVTGNGDSGIGVLGAQGPGANLVADNTVTNNGRYGIEIKVPNGSGAASGAGSIVVSGNTVTRTVAATDARDHAGIAVFRRSGNPTVNVDQPNGVVVTGNTVNGYHRSASGSTGDGFGIVVEGTNMAVDHNTVSSNDVGIQIQAGNIANLQGTPYFDRGDASTTSGTINRNSITGNTVQLRNVGAPLTDATCNWWGSAAGPGSISGATTAPFLTTSNLDGACGPTVSVSAVGATVTEGGTAGFNITLSFDPTAPVTVSYNTVDGTATTSSAAVGGADYTFRSGAVTFNPGGPLTQTVGVPTRNDTTDENDETFQLQLTGATNATIGTAVATKTIVDNDNSPKITIKDAAVVEGNPFPGSTTKTITFNVRLAVASGKTVTANWATRNGTGLYGAVGGVSTGDFVSATGTVTFAPGATSATVVITVRKDTTKEKDEQFFVDLSSLNNTRLGDGTGRGVITNDD